MNPSNNGWAQDLDALSRQYWNAWSEMGAQSGGQANGWQQMLDLWAPWARDGRASIDTTVERMNTQAGAWFGQMQQLAQQFAGNTGTPADIASAWKDMFGGGENPFAAMFAQGAGPGAAGIEQWMQHAAPMLEAWQGQVGGLLGMPAFGPGREQQERWQSLLQARLDYQQAMAAYAALLLQSSQRAFAVFEDKLTEHSEPGRQLDSARGLFDLWIDAAEQAWSEIALSQEYREVYGKLTNAQMRVRAGVQGQVERMTGQFGMPTRTEVNSGHRKVTQLEREVRELKLRLAALEANAAKPAASVKAASVAAAPAKAAPAKRAVKSAPMQAAPIPSRKPGRFSTGKPAAARTAAKPSAKAISPRKPVKPAARRAAK